MGTSKNKKSQRLFLDTNILLDMFDPDRDGYYQAHALLWFAAENPYEVELCANISSFKDVFYVLSRLYKSKEKAKEKVEFLLSSVITPLDLLASYGQRALDLGTTDFEDSLLQVCAESEGINVIISRDKKAFLTTLIPKMTAQHFLEQQGFDYTVLNF